MKLTFVGVRRWLEENAKECSEEELHTLAFIIESALVVVEKKNEEVQKKIDQILELARQVGLDENAINNFLAKETRLSASYRVPRTGIRRPYMNPFDEQSGIYAFPPNHPEKMPQWAKDAMNNGWSKNEMHYKNLADAWQKRNMKALYDPIKRHNDLQAAELEKGVFQRVRKI